MTSAAGDAPSPSEARLGVVLVTHDSERWLPAALAALEGATSFVVVDNHSRDRSPAMLSARDVPALLRSANEGYGRAGNLGVDHLGPDFDWYGIVNPDVAIDYASVSDVLAAVPSTIGAFSPLLVDENDRPRADLHRRRPTAVDTVGRYLVPGYAALTNQAGRKALEAAGRVWTSCAVTSGACLFVRGDLYRQLGGFDERFFFNNEDVDLCLRVGDLGYDVAVCGSVTGQHARGQSSGSATYNLRFFECARADILLAEKYRSPVGLLAVGGAVVIGAGARAVLKNAREGGRSEALRSWRQLTSELGAALRRRLAGQEPPAPAHPMFLPL